MFSSKHRYWFILFLSAYSYLNIKFTQGDELFVERLPELALISAIFFLVTFIWEGNRLIFRIIKYQVRSENVYKPLIVGFAASIFWVFILSAMAIFVKMLFGIAFSMIAMKLTMGFTFRVNLFLHCINTISSYHGRLTASQVDVEKVKKESAYAKHDALRRQINPHFLFNSLNVLDSLIRTNPEKASQFLEQLSTVYRYLTSNDEKNLVTVRSELQFLEAYKYLLEVRFKDNFYLLIDVPGEFQNRFIIPSALQLLVENAVKHNEVSKHHPLHVSIKVENEGLVIENSIKKKSQEVISSGTGLANIISRYAFFQNELPEISENQGVFKVKLPFIEGHPSSAVVQG